MQIADITILVMIGIPALIGVFYGFLNIVFSLLAWVVASVFAAKLTPLCSAMLEGYIQTTLFRDILVFAGLLIIGLIIFSLLGNFIVKLLGRTGLTMVDRTLGLLSGLGFGVAIIGVLVFLAGFTAFPEERWWQDSRLIAPLEKLSIWAHKYLPENLAEHHGYRPNGPSISVISDVSGIC